MTNPERYGQERFGCKNVYELRAMFNQYNWPLLKDMWKAVFVAVALKKLEELLHNGGKVATAATSLFSTLVLTIIGVAEYSCVRSISIENMYQNYPLVDNSFGFKSVLLASLGYRLYQSTLHTLDGTVYHGLLAFIYSGCYIMNNI
jgi:hypothetical protein